MLPYFYCRIECSVGLNCDQMEEGEQYSEYFMEGNPSAYMSMMDYINQSWQSQQPVERNPSEYRSMRDYRNQWMSSPYCHAPNPGPTRLADPNRFPGRETQNWDSLPDFFFKTKPAPMGKAHIL